MILQMEVKGDQLLLLREPITEIVMPEITRTLADFQMFAAVHNVSLVRITIQELMDELAKRSRLLAGDAVGADVVWAPLRSSVMTRFRRELFSTYGVFTNFFRKYKVGIHVYFLHLQVFIRDNLQNNKVNLGKREKIIYTLLPVAFHILLMSEI